MNFRSLRRRIRRLERAIKPKTALPVSGKCVGMTFRLYEGDPGVTIAWDSSGNEGGSDEPEPKPENVDLQTRP